ncbi:MAG: hypothetical protein JWM65_3757, partial [Sphingomonas bacterium]|nr:hypothetical protein [Sphingomonas bacterium]
MIRQANAPHRGTFPLFLSEVGITLVADETEPGD